MVGSDEKSLPASDLVEVLLEGDDDNPLHDATARDTTTKYSSSVEIPSFIIVYYYTSRIGLSVIY